MASFRLIDPLRTFWGQSGQLLAGGELRFYVAGTTTPQDVYGDKALTVNNGSTVALDASGRPAVDIWADTVDSYFIELYDEGGVKQGEIEDVEVPGGAGQTIPVPSSGEFISGDGSQYLLVDLSGRLVPDPSGHPNDYLQTDGTAVFWADGPETPAVPTLPITVTANSFRAGASGSDFYLEQSPATDESVPGGGSKTVTDSVVFATPYKAGTTPTVVVQLTGAGVTQKSSAYPEHSITAISNTGFTVTFSTLDGSTSTDDQAGANMTGTIHYTWVAKGVVADPG